MQAAEIQLLYAYNCWANRRILDTAESLSAEEFTTIKGHGCADLRAALVHTLSAEWIWRVRCQEGVSPTAMLSAADYPTLAALRERWQVEEEAMRGFVATLDEQALRQRISYSRTNGQRCEDVLWHLLLHMINHGTQHRGEAAAMLTEHGHSPGEIDMLIFLFCARTRRQSERGALNPRQASPTSCSLTSQRRRWTSRSCE